MPARLFHQRDKFPTGTLKSLAVTAYFLLFTSLFSNLLRDSTMSAFEKTDHLLREVAPLVSFGRDIRTYRCFLEHVLAIELEAVLEDDVTRAHTGMLVPEDCAEGVIGGDAAASK
jgi:hypothetical protein